MDVDRRIFDLGTRNRVNHPLEVLGAALPEIARRKEGNFRHDYSIVRELVGGAANHQHERRGWRPYLAVQHKH